MMYRPRPYQIEAIESIERELATHTSTLVDMSTGTGKTVLFTALAKRWPRRVLILAHRKELISQAAEKVRASLGEDPGIEMAQEKAHKQERGLLKSKVIVASVQTLYQENRLSRYDHDAFGLIVCDEAHHAVAGTYRAIFNHFRQDPEVKLLGVTATPQRADELAMGQVFESVAYRYPIWQAVEDGWLVPVEQHRVEVAGLDFSHVKSIAGDLSESQLDAILSEEEHLHKVAVPLLELAGHRQGLVFCCGVNHSRMMAEMLNRYRPGCAAFVSGRTPTEERDELVNQFRHGKIQFLGNCEVFLEGFDAPSCAVVAMARPTKSLSLYTQVLGRGTRPVCPEIDSIETAEGRRDAIANSLKPRMICIDFVGNSGKHKIISSSDVLGGKWGEPVKAQAKEIQEEEPDKPHDVAELLERAEAELAFVDHFKRVMRKRELIKARAQYSTQAVSPFGRTSGDFSPKQGTGPTPKQLSFLVHLGVPFVVAQGYSKRQASAVLDKLVKKQQVAT